MEPVTLQYLIPLLAAVVGYVIKHFFPNLIPFLPPTPAPAPKPAPEPLPALDHPLLSQLEQMLIAAARRALSDWMTGAVQQAQALSKSS